MSEAAGDEAVDAVAAAEAADAPPAPSYEWTAHPARHRPQDVMLLGAVLVFSAYAVLVGFESAFLAALAPVILIIAVAPFWAPTRYRIDGDGVSERRLGRHKFRAWPDLRRVSIGKGGALISPFAKPSFMDRYRGILVYFDGADRDRVVALLRARIPKAAA
jgi:hypothetical protein